MAVSALGLQNLDYKKKNKFIHTFFVFYKTNDKTN